VWLGPGVAGRRIPQVWLGPGVAGRRIPQVPRPAAPLDPIAIVAKLIPSTVADLRRSYMAVARRVFGICLMFAMFMFAIQNAQATPKIAKGRPCSACHAGSPPSKGNLKR
jgi:hypothetical protein